MPSKKLSNQLQKELELQIKKHQNHKIAEKILIAGISAIAILGFIGRQGSDLTQKETALGAASSLAFICWSLMRASNMRLNRENQIIYNTVNKFGETKLSFEKEHQVISNVYFATTVLMSAMFTSFIPVIASGLGKMNSSIASTAASLILISNEVFLKHMFNKNNKILKNALPIELQTVYKKQRER